MVINFMSRDVAQRKLFEQLVGSMLDYYHIPRSPSTFLTMAEEGQIEKVCAWLKKHKALDATPFRFESRTQVLAYGVEFEPSPNLTAELLKMQSNTVDS